MCDVCSENARYKCGTCGKAQYCSNHCQKVHFDKSHFFHCGERASSTSDDGSSPVSKKELAQLLAKAIEYLREPLKPHSEKTKVAVFQQAIEKCNGDAMEARIVYELVLTGLESHARMERSRIVLEYIFNKMGMHEKSIAQMETLNKSFYALQQKIAMAFIKDFQDIPNVADYLEKCQVILRTICTLLSASQGENVPEATSEETEKMLAEFFVNLFKSNFEHNEYLSKQSEERMKK